MECVCACVLCKVRTGKRERWGAAACTLFTPAAQAGALQRRLQQLHRHALTTPPPPPPPSRLRPGVWCHSQWCLCRRTPTARCKLRAEGMFQLLRERPDCCLSLLSSAPSLSAPRYTLQRALQTIGVDCACVCCIPVPCCSFCWAKDDHAMNPYWSLNRPRNSSLHQALCWAQLHSTHKVNRQYWVIHPITANETEDHWQPLHCLVTFFFILRILIQFNGF